MKLFLLTLFLSFSSLHCGKSKEPLPIYNEGEESQEKAIAHSPEPFFKSESEPNKETIQCEDQDCDESLLIAISKGDFVEAKALLEAGANPHHRSTHPENRQVTTIHALTFADNEQESIDFLPTLLNHGVDINSQNNNGSTALVYAILKKKYLLAQKLLQNENIDISIQNNIGSNIIHIFSDTDFTNPLALQTLNIILSKSDSNIINTQNAKGHTSLHYAIINGNTELLKALTSHPHINMNLENSFGNTPLMTSILNNNFQIATDLLEAGADPNHHSIKKGKITALHILAFTDTSQESTNFLQTLFKHGVDINAQDDKGHTSLHKAVIHKQIDFLKALASHPNLNINIKNTNGDTPIYFSLGIISIALGNTLSQEKEAPTVSQLDKMNQTLQILLNSPHEVDLTPINNKNRSSYDIVSNIIIQLLLLPHDSPLYSSFEAIADTLALITGEQEPTTQSPEENEFSI